MGQRITKAAWQVLDVTRVAQLGQPYIWRVGLIFREGQSGHKPSLHLKVGMIWTTYVAQIDP